jgi:serine/threonine-protein kinase HipA
MTSEPDLAFVWVWLPGARRPVVAGRLDRGPGGIISFTYGRSYLAREDAIPLYLPELPLRRGPIAPLAGTAAGCIRDAAPDSWGQRVILSRRVGAGPEDTGDLGLLTYLLESGSDRIGALDFASSSEGWVPRATQPSSLTELIESAQRVEAGVPLTPALDQALLHGSSVGGARPKAVLRDGDRSLIAKFSSTADTYALVKGEFAAMELARRAGIDAARVQFRQAMGKDVLLVERFDRLPEGERRALVSALTILELDEFASSRYGSYVDLADQVRRRFTAPEETLHELFARITFNILTGNTDDHPRNHAAFWDGSMLTLTPAYDICPQPRAGGEAAQLMAIGRDGWRMSQLAGCIDRANEYLLSEAEAREIVDRQIEVIERDWDEVCDLAGMTTVERAGFRGRQFLNAYVLEGYGRAMTR